MLDTHARKYVQPLLDRIAGLLIRMGISANAATITAFAAGVLSAGALCLRWLWPAVALLWLSGLLDAVDGTIARKTNTSSPLGTLLDIVFDRIVEILQLLALIYIAPELALCVAVVLSCIIVSMTIFLTVGAASANKRENDVKKTFYYQAGLAERSEGFIMITLAVLLEKYRAIVLLAFAAMILFTAFQRFMEAVRLFGSREKTNG
ncbi:MAG: CDP-alcohol phosphatidyltransferase family protein [Treponema sp.]|jgi:phosphatidylglycerophosphate synthase|nr:CDP-alcohol phosphatidyltransferase family protein [Treponema sp.]